MSTIQSLWVSGILSHAEKSDLLERNKRKGKMESPRILYITSHESLTAASAGALVLWKCQSDMQWAKWNLKARGIPQAKKCRSWQLDVGQV